MSVEQIIGYVGAFTISLLQIPQVYKCYQTKSAKDLSWGMLGLNVFASVIWFIYGIILWKFPIIISNILYFIANITLCSMKIKYNLTPTSLTPTS